MENPSLVEVRRGQLVTERSTGSSGARSARDGAVFLHFEHTLVIPTVVTAPVVELADTIRHFALCVRSLGRNAALVLRGCCALFFLDTRRKAVVAHKEGAANTIALVRLAMELASVFTRHAETTIAAIALMIIRKLIIFVAFAIDSH